MAEQKEVTILNLTERINGQLHRLHGRLDEAFDRRPEADSSKEVRESHANVLDEIIERQEEASKHIEVLHVFINQKVIPKIM